MKTKSLLSIALFIIAISNMACGDDDEENQPISKDEVKVSFVYALDTSNGSSMKRVVQSNADVFNEFYENIINGDMVAPTYELTLKDVNTGVEFSFNGSWANHDIVTINTGTYRVFGKSIAYGANIQDKCSLSFDELIEIDTKSSSIVLHADYNCYLLIFNKSNINSLENFSGSKWTSFYDFNNYKYAFVNEQLYDNDKKNDSYIIGKSNANAEFKIYTGNLCFEKGKYYVYNSISNSFDIPPMGEGTESETNREIEGFGKVANAVDLGLSVKWASWNVGASKEGDYGGLYGAGDPTGLKTATTYSNYYYKSGESVCGTEYDLAHVKWGGHWRLPTTAELKELRDKCTWTKNVTIDGVVGSMAKGPNGNTIFFPYAGNRQGNSVNRRGEHESIWSGDMSGAIHSYGYMDLDINNDGTFQMDGCSNWIGQSIRPVYDN